MLTLHYLGNFIHNELSNVGKVLGFRNQAGDDVTCFNMVSLRSVEHLDEDA